MPKLLSSSKLKQHAELLRLARPNLSLTMADKSALFKALIAPVVQTTTPSLRTNRKRTAFKGDLINNITNDRVTSRRKVTTIYPALMINIREKSSKGTKLPITSWGWCAEEEVLKVQFTNTKTTYVYAYYKVRQEDINKINSYNRFWDFYNDVIEGKKKVVGLI